METLSKPVMKFAELLNSYEFSALTPRQKVWVTTLLESGENTGTYDFIGATTTAFPEAKKRSIVVRTAQLQSHPGIKRILTIYFGRTEPEHDPFFDELKRAIRKTLKKDGYISVATHRAISFYCAKTGLNALPKEESETPTAAVPPAKFYVGQIITEKDDAGVERTARITAVDVEGNVLNFEEAAE